MNKTKSAIHSRRQAKWEAAAREFERPHYAPKFAKPTLAEQRRHDRAIRQAQRKVGRPAVGQGAERVQVTVEKALLKAADRFARAQHISRSQLIARGLRLAMAS